MKVSEFNCEVINPFVTGGLQLFLSNTIKRGRLVLGCPQRRNKDLGAGSLLESGFR